MAWTLQPFEADDGTMPFQRFIDELSDFKFVALDTALKRVLSVRGIELARTEWLKALGDGLHEFRVRHAAAETAARDRGRSPATRPVQATTATRASQGEQPRSRP